MRFTNDTDALSSSVKGKRYIGKVYRKRGGNAILSGQGGTLLAHLGQLKSGLG